MKKITDWRAQPQPFKRLAAALVLGPIAVPLIVCALIVVVGVGAAVVTIVTGHGFRHAQAAG